jgi:hypothetical protein
MASSPAPSRNSADGIRPFVCHPGLAERNVRGWDERSGRIDHHAGDKLVGFVLSGLQAKQGMQLYRELYG